jgi:fucose permease
MIVKSRTSRLIAVAFLVFVSLGLSSGVLGVAWPSMRSDLVRPLSDLGTLLAVSTAGYFLAGLVAGRLTKRFGVGDILVAAMTLGTISLLGYATAEEWVLLLASSVGVGITGGLIDSVINAYVALNHGTRTMNLLHASFGIGATTGPLLVASSLARGLSWRSAFVVLATVEALLLVTVFVVRRQWPVGDTSEAHEVAAAGSGVSVVGLLGIFFFYVGIEVAAGQWSYSVLTQGRGVGEFPAGVWVAIYWGGLTGGRLALGAIGDRIGPRTTLNLSMLGTLLGAVLFWADPGGLGVLGLPVLGVSLAGVFPVLVSLTPAWVGPDRTPTVVGQQIAAAMAGAASLPWLAGRWMDASGLERLGPFLFGAALLMTLLHVYVDRTSNGNARVKRAAATNTPHV